MSNDVKKTLETESVTVDNMGGHNVAVPGSSPGNTTEKRTLPLLYVQSPINKSNNCDFGNESVKPINVPKLGAPVTLPNGVTAGAKLVQVQTPNQNIAYVGTFFKQSTKGKDIVPQKVLLTPLKRKEMPMARLILPRPSAPASGVVSGKKICRSFVVSPVTQTSLIKPNDSSSGKIVQPNIIRQRGVEAKLITGTVIKPGSVSKTTVSSGLTLVKAPQIQSGEKPAVKVILLDVKEDISDKPETSNNDPLSSKANRLISVDDKSNNEKTSSSDNVNAEDDTEKSKKSLIKCIESESDGIKAVSTSSDKEKTVEINKAIMQWEEKEGNSSPFQTTVDRARKRKGSLLSSIPGTPKKVLIGDPYENIKLFPGGEEYDPFKIIDWDSHGLGNLPESSIKVVKNEFDMVEILESGDSAEKKKSDEIFCCISCSCYGLISEFYNENYCSIRCRDELMALHHSIFAKKDSDLETSDTIEKKKTNDSGIIKMAVFGSESKSLSKSSDKTVPLGGSELSPLKSSESDVIDLIDNITSPDSESSLKKVSTEDSKYTKVKKILTKGLKINKKSDMLKSITQLTPEKSESTSKIKLRPRSGGKMYKSSSTEDIVAQDLDMGSSNVDNENSKKKSFTTRFRWNIYLNETKSSGAWVKLFNNPFPSRPNRFKVGQKLEAIDPEHQSKICLTSVSEVKGYRLKLHFDGYRKDYDFWVNADDPNLFPSEFCSKHKIPLQIPPVCSVKLFDWDTYLSRQNAKAAPQSCFENNTSSLNQVNLFKVDMKLEAVDRKNTYLVCVSTVAAVMENRILVHFDSWDEMYDYWVDISSPYIRPVGWCKSANHELTPPNGIKPEDFSWKKYLKETKSVAAPEKAFVLRPHIEFKKGMKIEAVDKRAPHLIRVATISEVLPYQVKITFDGFPAHFGYWVDDDCHDIHPVGWSSRAGHPLEPPPTAEDFSNSACPTPGCVGQGYFKGTKKEAHTLVTKCPYTTENLGKDPTLTDRLKWSSKSLRRNSNDAIFPTGHSIEESDDEPEEMKWAWMKRRQNLKNGVKREKAKDYVESSQVDDENKDDNTEEEKNDSNVEIKTEDTSMEELDKTEDITDNTVKQEKCSDEECSDRTNDCISLGISIKEEESESMDSEFFPSQDSEEQKSVSPLKTDSNLNNNSIDVSKNCKTVNMITEQGCLDESNPLYWSIHQVSKFTRPLISCSKDCFLEEEIDGQGLLMLSKSDLLEYLGLSDSDAERVYTNINMLRQKAM